MDIKIIDAVVREMAAHVMKLEMVGRLVLCTCRAQWLRGRAPTTRTRFRILSCGVKTLGNFVFTLYCYSSLSCIKECLAINIGGYVYEQPWRINCSIWLDGVWVNRSVREVKCKALWTVLKTGYCAIDEFTFALLCVLKSLNISTSSLLYDT